VLKSHVRLWLKTNTGAEDVSQSATLLGKGVDDWSSRWSKRSLKHVAEDAQYAMELLVVLGSNTVGLRLPGDTGHQLGDEDQIDDQWRSQKGVLADIEETSYINNGYI
jgi:hypothetical protein